MTLEWLPYRLTVAKYEAMPQTGEGFFSLSATGSEISLVCESEKVPQGFTCREDNWRAFRVAGALDFSLVGVLAAISSALAEGGIALFALSTFDTDYILVKEKDRLAATAALKQKGYIVI